MHTYPQFNRQNRYTVVESINCYALTLYAILSLSHFFVLLFIFPSMLVVVIFYIERLEKDAQSIIENGWAQKKDAVKILSRYIRAKQKTENKMKKEIHTKTSVKIILTHTNTHVPEQNCYSIILGDI